MGLGGRPAPNTPSALDGKNAVLGIECHHLRISDYRFSIAPHNWILTSRNCLLNMSSESAAMALRESFGDRKIPEISRKITACVACRKLKVSAPGVI